MEFLWEAALDGFTFYSFIILVLLLIGSRRNKK